MKTKLNSVKYDEFVMVEIEQSLTWFTKKIDNCKECESAHQTGSDECATLLKRPVRKIGNGKLTRHSFFMKGKI